MVAASTAQADAPFFLVGAVRSGTTMLRLLLAHHSQICRCNEMEFVASAISGRAGWPDLRAYRQEVEPSRAFRELGLQFPESASFPELAARFLQQRQSLDGRPIVGATVHNHFDELPRIWPGARYIYLVRDPRDVARSCVQMGWAGNAWEAAAIWKTAHVTWQRLRASLPSERLIEVRYEDLMSHAESELDRIARFLGVAFEPGMLDIERDTNYKRPDPRASRSWRSDAPARDVREVEARLGPMLREAGYEPSGLPAMRLSPMKEWALHLEHRIGRMRFGQRRYGLRLWLAHVIARRSPFDGWRRRVFRAMENVDIRHLK